MARVIAVLAGHGPPAGATVNRFCASSTQTMRMAFHAIKAGEGDVFLSGGVECVSQYGKFAGAGGSRPDDQNPLFAGDGPESSRDGQDQRGVDRPA
jgi:acetyl-CoA C-acetyltransferase